jgi:hypothetical protein
LFSVTNAGVVFTGAASVLVTRYRYHGRHTNPWSIKPAAAD